MSKHHRTMTYRDKVTLAAEMINEGKTYRDVAEAMQYKSEGSVSRVIRDAKAQGLIKTGSEWKREVLAEKERAEIAELALEKACNRLAAEFGAHPEGGRKDYWKEYFLTVAKEAFGDDKVHTGRQSTSAKDY